MAMSIPFYLGTCFYDQIDNLFVFVSLNNTNEYAVSYYADPDCYYEHVAETNVTSDGCTFGFNETTTVSISYAPCTAGETDPIYADPSFILFQQSNNCDPTQPTVMFNFGNSTNGECIPYGPDSYASLVSFSGVLFVVVVDCDSVCENCQYQYQFTGLGSCSADGGVSALVNTFDSFDSCYLPPTTTTPAPTPYYVSLFSTFTKAGSNAACDMTQPLQMFTTDVIYTAQCTLSPLTSDYYILRKNTSSNTLYLAYGCSSDCSQCQYLAQTIVADACVPLLNGMSVSFGAMNFGMCPAGFVNPANVPSTFVYLQWSGSEGCNLQYGPQQGLVYNFGNVSSTMHCQPFVGGTYASVTKLTSSYVALLECATSSCTNCKYVTEFAAEEDCVQLPGTGYSVSLLPISSLHSCYVPPTTLPPPPIVYLNHISTSTCDISQPGSSSRVQVAETNRCNWDQSSNTYYQVTALNAAYFQIQFDCYEDCYACESAPLLISLDQCTPDPVNYNFSYVLTTSFCPGAYSNMETVSSSSVSVIWNENTADCELSIGESVDVFNFGVPSLASSTCQPFLFGTYAYIVPATVGTFNALLFCNQECTQCDAAVTLQTLNSCFESSSSYYPGSAEFTHTVALATCPASLPSSNPPISSGDASGISAGTSYVIILSVCLCVSAMAVAVLYMIRRKPEEREQLITY